LNIHIATKEEITSNLLSNFLTAAKFLPYSEYEIPIDQLKNYVVADLYDSLEKGSHIILAEENNKFLGLLAGGKLEWDSKHFGVEIGNIKYLFASGDYVEKKQLSRELIEQFTKTSNLQLVIARSHTEDTSLIHALEESSFQLMDTLVTHNFDFKNRVAEFEEKCKIEPLKNETPELKKIAKTCFSESKVSTDHFHADHRLDEIKSDALYEKWIEEASKDKDTVVLVAKIDNQPVGFITGKINHQFNRFSNKKIGILVLSGVSPEYRQAQVYTSMIHATLRWFSDKVDIAELGTQIGNYSVQRVWPKFGTKIVRSQNTWHMWI
jgi:hypothetical protein